ncbi:double zinc ribbon domain-containing protein [Treponema succinifaciens]|uniref:double zinc ribbon domain-containing protein n=1 Tax=Treponema succinifaciens TaxID=167 RepID=UPI003F8189E9
MKALSISLMVLGFFGCFYFCTSYIFIFVYPITLLLLLIPAYIAQSKGRDFWSWFVYSWFFWIIALVHSIVMQENNTAKIRNREAKKCPFCFATIDTRASVCQYCGRQIYNNNVQNVTARYFNMNGDSASPVADNNNYWKCKKCGYEENSETSAFCEKCGAISESKKSVLKSFINRQLSSSTLSEITNCQSSYFNTDSLSWLKEIVPNVEDFTDINEYKENLKTVSQKYI